MLTVVEGQLIRLVKPIESAGELREALERLRRMETVDEDSSRARERTELELRICRYLASREHRIR